MPHVDKHAPGTFCWVELETTDLEAAKAFYDSLFGWSFVDHPMGPAGVYTIFQLNGREAAAAYQQQESERARGVRSHWNLYIAADDADASAARAAELGATILAGPFDVTTSGRMAILSDPTGAVFCLWQPNKNAGLGVMGENNCYCWADLSTADRAGAKRFYERLFGWKAAPGKGKDDSTYLHIGLGEHYFAGILPDSHRNPKAPPHWMAYFMTSDADAATEKAQALGATVVAPPMNVGESLRMAILCDPQGAVFALFQA
ncbi:MAG TPA: VOC family protein [Bryobacteraceae bacterium]|nr:VOC family protein [Bryobacteraceae bacterium]